MSRSKVKGHGHQGQKGKTAELSPLTMHSKACAVGRTQQAATDDTIAWSKRDDDSACWRRIRRWENQRMLRSSIYPWPLWT